VSLRESNAVKDATEEKGIVSEVLLSSISDQPRQSEVGEILRAMEHISEKAQKFPTPAPTFLHVVLADTRGYLIGMGDRDDYREMAYGTNAVPPERAHDWRGIPIFGLFDTANTRTSAS
jgi:hypothetical protein